MGGIAGDLIDLVLPGQCPGCGEGGSWRSPGLCPHCWASLSGGRPIETRPHPMPTGFPPTMAATEYAGVMRELLLAYKERGRHRLAGLLGDRLAAVVYAGLTALDVAPGTPLVLVPVPDTAAAARARYGDHLRRLAQPTAQTLIAAGFPATVRDLVRARPRPDSATLDSVARIAAAAAAFEVRPFNLPAGSVVILLDDIVTTGATLATISNCLSSAGVHVSLAAVLAATQRRIGSRRIPNG